MSDNSHNYCQRCGEILPGYVHTCPNKVQDLRDQLAARDRELADLRESHAVLGHELTEARVFIRLLRKYAPDPDEVDTFLARRAPTNQEPPGKVLVDAAFLREAKRLFSRAEDRLPMGVKLNADIASWIDRANALIPTNKEAK